MHCLLCERFSFSHICKQCQKEFLSPALYKRKLPNGVEVFSFYKYEEIKPLLFTKHTEVGFYIFKILAKNSFKRFAKEFHTKERYVSLAIDDNPKENYSHTAILNNALTTYNIQPLFNKLRANNQVNYSGKTKAFRQANPRNFQVRNFPQTDVILVDDIITTGSTLTEAIEKLQHAGKQIPFCLTLSDVKND